MQSRGMIDRQDGLHYRVVGIKKDGTRDPRYRNLSWLTAEQVQRAMLLARLYADVVIEDQLVVTLPVHHVRSRRAMARQESRSKSRRHA